MKSQFDAELVSVKDMMKLQQRVATHLIILKAIASVIRLDRLLVATHPRAGMVRRYQIFDRLYRLLVATHPRLVWCVASRYSIGFTDCWWRRTLRLTVIMSKV
ncbi:MAG: hypothetical protein HC941_20875 [Microcoleus sp. SU_5_3]|nr:hypothetical protein [Microcoleus sp. SU_5_3]